LNKKGVYMNAINYIFDTTFNAVIGLPLAAYETLSLTTEATVGVAGSAASILTGGIFTPINKLADFTKKASYILPQLYIGIGSVVNPDFSFDPENPMGLVTQAVAAPIFSLAGKAAQTDDVVSREIVARGAYLLGAAVAVITRLADLAIGLVAAAVSIIPLFGRVRMVNVFAVEHLMSLAVIHDVCGGLRGFINPGQFAPLVQPGLPSPQLVVEV
jgi:hypothetical protein